MGNSKLWTEDVTEREIPKTRLGAICLLVLLLVTTGVIVWELQMRSLGLAAGDLDDSKAHWAVERRKVAAGDYDEVAIIGSSRILFDTDLDVWEEMTGRRPIQLAVPGTSPRPCLTAFANDPDFRACSSSTSRPRAFSAKGRVTRNLPACSTTGRSSRLQSASVTKSGCSCRATSHSWTFSTR